MAYMSSDKSGEPGLRIQCPEVGCDYELSEAEWTTHVVSDHHCSNCGTWFRVEGDDPENLDEFAFYTIQAHEIKLENLR